MWLLCLIQLIGVDDILADEFYSFQTFVKLEMTQARAKPQTKSHESLIYSTSLSHLVMFRTCMCY
jgi:hypothetical protein